MFTFSVIHNSRNTGVCCLGICPSEALALSLSLIDNLESGVWITDECPLIRVLNEAHRVSILCDVSIAVIGILSSTGYVPF